MHFSIREIFMAGWPVMSLLLLCSIISFAIILDRWNYFRKKKIDVKNFCDKIAATGTLPKESHGASSLASVLRLMTENTGAQKDSLESGAQNLIRIEMLQAERFVPALGTIASATPFIGLLGTVIGIIRAFQTISFTGGGGAQVVAGGIAEALVSTALGLVVAIPALIAYNFFSTKARNLNESLEICAGALIHKFGKE